jgi:UDP-N-acetylmuramoyl-L-alanyl-D-glutamate--2,6-diaminopimelate ligase
MMGRIAADLSDLAFVTDDNPRSENPEMIRAAIMAGGHADKLRDHPDRRAAIRHAVGQLTQGDVLVIAGKGHEQGQIFATHTDPFDDVAEAMAAIEILTKSET